MKQVSVTHCTVLHQMTLIIIRYQLTFVVDLHDLWFPHVGMRPLASLPFVIAVMNLRVSGRRGISHLAGQLIFKRTAELVTLSD
jgi:hypothetical protein